jgi:uncharacterized membrane protein YccC
MNTDALEELCSRLDAQAAILEACGERIDVDLHLKTSDALRDALAEIERLRSDAELHLKTSDALRDELAEIERLRSEADAELHRGKGDRGMSNPATTFSAIDWFFKLLDPYSTKNKPK